MSVHFNQSEYHSLGEEYRATSTGLQFKYGGVSYGAYAEQYDKRPSSYHLPHKITALPRAAWAGVAKTVYHIASAVFVGIPKAIYYQDGSHVKSHVFCVVRDLEESFGYLLSIVHNKSGEYFIQESSYQKSCYEEFTKQRSQNRKTPDTAPTTTSVDSEVDKKNAAHFSAAMIFLSREKYDAAIEEADKIGNVPALQDLIYKIASQGFIENRKYDAAIETTGKIHDDLKTRNTLYAQLSELLIADKQNEKDFELIDKITK